jgi:hypothetical protein
MTMMEKQFKHSNDYIGSFSDNPHIAQCYQCWLANIDEKEIIQEWFQKKTMQCDPSEKHTFQDGSTKIQEEMFFCKAHVESWKDAENGYEGWSNDEYNEHVQHLVNSNQRPILVEILN